MTYASNKTYHRQLAADNSSYHLLEVDICETKEFSNILEEFRPSGIFHLAAESHVDNSIHSSECFVQTNIMGTHSVLQAAKDFTSKVADERSFKFVHVSTDEVYGSLSKSSSELFK